MICKSLHALIRGALAAAFPLATLILFAGASPSYAADADSQPKKPITIMADEVYRNSKSGLSEAKGNVSVQYDDRVITGDAMYYDEKSGEGMVEGNAWYQDPKAKIYGEKVKFNSVTKLGTIYRAMGNSEQRYFFSGEKIVREKEDRYEITGGGVTTCPQDHPHWRMEGDKVDLTLEGYAVLKNMVFRAGGVPILYLPYMIAPAKTKRATGLLTPGGGYSSKNGLELSNSFFWAISDNTDATLSHRYMGKSGNQAGLEYRYIFSEQTQGNFYAEYMKETDPDKTANRNLWKVNYDHRQALPWQINNVVKLNMESEDSISREYSDNVVDRSKSYNDSYITFTRNFTTRSLSLMVREQKSTDPANASRVQRAPEFKFTNQKEALWGSNFYGSLDSSFTSLRTDTGLDEAKTAFDVDRFDFFPQISYPLPLTPWLSMDASAGYRYSWYSRGVATTGELYDQSFGRQYYVTRLALTGPKIFRIFETGAPERPRLKHLITPKLSWSYLPGYDFDGDNRQRVKAIDANIDPSTPANALQFELQNILLAKDVLGPENSVTTQLLSFNVSESYDINEANRTDIADSAKRPFSSLQFDLSTKPLNWLYFRYLTTYNFYDSFWDSASAELGLKMGNVANFALDRSYKWGGTTVADTAWDTAFLELLLPWGISADFSAIYDEVNGWTKDSMARVRFRDDCWGFALNFQKRRVTVSDASTGSTTQSDENRFFFTITLIGIGDVLGAEQPALSQKKL